MRPTQWLFVAVCCVCALAAVARLPTASAQSAAAAGAPTAAAAAAPAAAATGAAPLAKGKAVKGKATGKAKAGKAKGKAPPPPGKYKGKQKMKAKAVGGVAAEVGAAAGDAKWSAADFLGGAKAKANANAVVGGGLGGGDDDDEEDVEDDPSKSWEEEEELANWEEEDDENMPKFITIDRLNDSATIAKLKRHQLLRIGRSLLRDPKFNDCLVHLVLSLIDTAKASTCAAPDVNDLADRVNPTPEQIEQALKAGAAVVAPVAGDASATDPAANVVAGRGAAGETNVDRVNSIVNSVTKQADAPTDAAATDATAAVEIVGGGAKASGTNPTGIRTIPRNLPGEANAARAHTQAQLQGVPISATVDPTTGVSEHVAQPTPYNPSRVVTYNIIGRTAEFPTAPAVHAEVTPQTEVFDVAIVGCGLSGLTAMYRVRNLTVVCLEWSDEPGGIAAQQTKDNITWATGAAYAPVPYAAILDLWHEIGLPKPEEIELGKPRDSFWVDKNLYLGIWEEALDDLPEDWYEFKALIDALDYAGMIGVPPLEREREKAKIFDHISAGELIENFGTKLKTMLDLYCRSALGSVCADISAMAFLDFYSDELYERVAFPGGTGAVTKRLVELIRAQDPSRIRTGVWVYDIAHVNDTMVRIRYVDTKVAGGSTATGLPHTILARRVIMATPVNIGAKIIKDLPEPQRRVMESVEHMHYLVHNVHTPVSYFHSSYDTWTADVAFTDIIVARWQEATLSNTPVQRANSILSVYQPLPRSYWKQQLTDAEVRALSEEMLVDLEKLLPGYKTADTIWIDTHRWPGSINILRPGLSTGAEGATMRANHGRIIFAGSNLGIPSLEEAIERGLIAAKELHRLRAAEAATEARVQCDAGRAGLSGSCDAADDALRAQSAEEKEAAEQKRAVDAASGAVASDSKP